MAYNVPIGNWSEYVKKAVNGQDSSSWGVYFNTANDKFVLFKGDDYVSGDSEYELETEYSNAYVVTTNFGDEIYFSLFSGTPSMTGTTTITSVSTNESQDIVIKASGVIQIND